MSYKYPNNFYGATSNTKLLRVCSYLSTYSTFRMYRSCLSRKMETRGSSAQYMQRMVASYHLDCIQKHQNGTVSPVINISFVYHELCYEYLDYDTQRQIIFEYRTSKVGMLTSPECVLHITLMSYLYILRIRMISCGIWQLSSIL